MAAVVPPEPRIGSLENNIPWCGGRPNPTWAATTSQRPASPYAKRYTDKNEMTVYQAMTKGLPTKLKRGDPVYSLTAFTEDVKAHLVKVGMDSVFWFLDPVDNATRHDLVYQHALFTIAQVRTETNVMTEVIAAANRPALFANLAHTYDEYDAMNLSASREFLLDSLDETLKASLRTKITADMLGPEVWMMITSELQSGSYRAMEKKKDDLKSLRLADFPGEDVKALNGKVVTLCSELERANRLPEDALVTVVQKYGKSTVEEFRIGSIARRNEVENYVARNAGRTDAQILAAGQELITYRTLTEEAESKYQSLLDSNEWTAVQTTKDKSNAPEAFNFECLSADAMKIMFECHQATNATGQIICHGCGKPGHIVRFCPNNGGGGNNHNNLSNSGGGGSADGKKKKRWQNTPPKVDEAKQKVVNGTTWKWCAHCARWTKSHDTEAHSGPRQNATTASPGQEGNGTPEGNIGEMDDGDFGVSGFVGAW